MERFEIGRTLVFSVKPDSRSQKRSMGPDGRSRKTNSYNTAALTGLIILKFLRKSIISPPEKR